MKRSLPNRSNRDKEDKEDKEDSAGYDGRYLQGRGREDRPDQIIEEGLEIDENTSLTPEEEKKYDETHGKKWPQSG